VAITVTRYLWAPSSGDHFIYMWRLLQAATHMTATVSIICKAVRRMSGGL